MTIPGFRKSFLWISVAAYLSGAIAVDGAALAQGRGGPPWSGAVGGNWSPGNCDRWDNRDTPWCRRAREDEHRRREAERDRHKDNVAKGVVAGAVGAVVIGGIVAAIASSEKEKERRKQERRRYCAARYGSYDERTDTYRATDGRWYPCE